MPPPAPADATPPVPAAAAPPAPSLAFLRGRLAGMSTAERKIADAILDAPTDVLNMTITELADRATVSEATISRFCRRLKLRGYQELRIRIAQELAPNAVSAAGTAFDRRPEWMRTAVLRATGMIEETANLLDSSALSRAIDLLSNARRVLCVGQGASGVTALDAAHHLMSIGIATESHTDPHVTTVATALLTPDDVVLAFSRTGSTKDVAACLRLARSQRVPIVAVTSAPRSPVAQLSTVVLQVADEGTVIGNLYSKMMQLFVLEVLVEGCADALGPTAHQASKKVIDAILGKLY
ncbi:MurR/RpiR family transcriptional regulator [Micromonospora sp. NPDC047740]|uniref:MurR/RpiR family transcriptional regulator n=1 Tax=Micromonospora sp. NPDC047740 TaxID=3364254 RepID=UPI003718E4E1